MTRIAANIYRANDELVKLHQRIVGLRRLGLHHAEIAEATYMSLNGVRHHLRDNCNCKNGRRAAVAAAGTSRQAQA